MDIEKRKCLIKSITNLVSSLSAKEREDIFNELLRTKKDSIPISVFKINISGLEIIVKYLREIEDYSFKEISRILNRRLSTIYNTYANSKSKFKGRLDVSDCSVCIPFKIFSDREYSILEIISAYLIDEQNLSFADASKLLNRSQSTIRTVYRRYKLKRAGDKDG